MNIQLGDIGVIDGVAAQIVSIRKNRTGKVWVEFAYQGDGYFVDCGIKHAERFVAIARHASIRDARRRKRKAKQARKVSNPGTYKPKSISQRAAIGLLAAALLGGLKE